MTRPDQVEQKRTLSFAQLFKKAQELSTAGKYRAAIDTSTVCLELLQQETTVVLLQRGKDLRMNRQQHLAISDFEKAEQLAAAVGNKDLTLTAIIGKVDALRTGDRDPEFPYPTSVRTDVEKIQYRFQLIPDYLVKAQHLMEKMPDSDATINALNQFGLVFDEAKDFQQSVTVYTQSEMVCRRLLVKSPADESLRERLARAIHLKGRALGFLGLFEEAKVAEEESLEISVEQGNLINAGNARLSLGDAELGLDNINKAKFIWEETRKIAEKGSDKERFRLASERLAKL